MLRVVCCTTRATAFMLLVSLFLFVSSSSLYPFVLSFCSLACSFRLVSLILALSSLVRHPLQLLLRRASLIFLFPYHSCAYLSLFSFGSLPTPLLCLFSLLAASRRSRSRPSLITMPRSLHISGTFSSRLSQFWACPFFQLSTSISASFYLFFFPFLSSFLPFFLPSSFHRWRPAVCCASLLTLGSS